MNENLVEEKVVMGGLELAINYKKEIKLLCMLFCI